MGLIDRPLGYIGPNLNPTGVQFRPNRLAQSVFALLTSSDLRDKSGCVVGHRGVNGPTARQIQASVRTITEKPMLYLVN